jgi:hypothetical protein
VLRFAKAGEHAVEGGGEVGEFARGVELDVFDFGRGCAPRVERGSDGASPVRCSHRPSETGARSGRRGGGSVG